MDLSVALVTVPAAEPTTEPIAAFTVKLPVPSAINSPLELMVATLDGDTLQVVELVRDAVLPSE
jgi:hypothetical protein